MSKLKGKWLDENSITQSKIVDEAVSLSKLDSSVITLLPSNLEKAAISTTISTHNASGSNPFATKSYVDSIINGLSWKSPVATLSSLPTTGNSPNDTRVVADTDQTYTWDEAGSQWIQISSGSIPLASKEVAGKVQVGNGISINAGVISAAVDDLSIEIIGTSPNGSLGVKVDNTSLVVNSAAGLQVKDLGVTSAKLFGSIPDSKLNTISTLNKVFGTAVQLRSGGAINANASTPGLGVNIQAVNPSLEIISNELKVKHDATLLSTASGLKVNVASNERAVEEFVVAAGDLTSSGGFVTLVNTPKEVTDVELHIVGGIRQQYGTDYNVHAGTKRLWFGNISNNPSSTLTSGGIFSDLAVGDVLVASYTYTVLP